MKTKIALLVEDSSDDEVLALQALKKNKAPTEVIVARDGAEALNYLFGEVNYQDRDTSIRPEIVLLDLNLPKINGLEVVRRIRNDKRTKYLPVVILTSSNADRDLAECYDLGANSYIRKSVDFTEFGETVRQLSIYWLTLNTSAPKTESD